MGQKSLGHPTWLAYNYARKKEQENLVVKVLFFDRWHKAFAEGQEDVNDENRAGRPSTSSSDDNVKRVRGLLNTDRRLSVRLISETLDITKTIVHEIVSESLGMRKVCAKLVPNVLTDDQKAHCPLQLSSPFSRLLAIIPVLKSARLPLWGRETSIKIYLLRTK
ncbi:hypothetical protein NQ318_019246 [Aromia moschata]|uniref:Uncharacterized protein n=1 Tax=Aromia moschata TaxID=1265417 RepID=A0AAV8YY00_9CUCU|nr:hypothetical protein NQ318_019246 [Aromia moschata]